MHLHLREGEILSLVAPLSAHSFCGAVIMPNLMDPVDTKPKVLAYRERIYRACENENFSPFMTLFFKPFSQAELASIKDDIFGIKLYPAGITTQSVNGVSDFNDIMETLSVMEELGIPLLVHGESGGFVMDREKEFCVVYRDIAKRFPRLHIIMEHITTRSAVELLDEYENLSATVTLHHLLITLDDVAGGMLEPDLFCKPIAKTPDDREALRNAVFRGHPKIMFGSDSAPHPRHRKECVGCAAGIFSAPVALPLLTQIFEKEGCLDKLQGFISDIACKRYGIEPPEKRITLTKKTWQIPEQYGDIRPFYAGKKIRWSFL
jgi:dihydroorotase